MQKIILSLYCSTTNQKLWLRIQLAPVYPTYKIISSLNFFSTAFCILQRHKTYILWKFKIYDLTVHGRHIFPFEITLLFLSVLGSSKQHANQRQLLHNFFLACILAHSESQDPHYLGQ